MNRYPLRSLTALAFVLLTSWLIADEIPAPSSPVPLSQAGEGSKRPPSPPLLREGGGGGERENVQDFVFLARSRPILLRLRVRVEGKPLASAWGDFMKYLFTSLDRDGDGVLSEQEVERAPHVDQLTGGSNDGTMYGSTKTSLSMKDFDANKDGKTSLAELSAYYRSNGMTPFQFQFDDMPNAGMDTIVFAFSGSKPEPSVNQVSQAIFNWIDADKDGKLTPEELDAAASLLLARDENEDEILTAREVVPEEKPKDKSKPSAMTMMMSFAPKAAATTSPLLIPIPVSGQAPPNLAIRMSERYHPSAKKTEAKPFDKAPASSLKEGTRPLQKTEAKVEPKSKAKQPLKEDKKEPPKKWTRKQIPFDAETFARLDADRDGALDDKELEAFVRRDPDLCLTVSLDGKDDKPLALEAVSGKPAALAAKFRIDDEVGILDLAASRLELRRGEEKNRTDMLVTFVKPQLKIQFKQADKDNNGYLDEPEAKNFPLGGSFKQMDRDGDGKLYEKEILDYFDAMLEMRKRASNGCATLVFSDQSRGLFDLLDTNRDGRLSLREIKRTPKLLAQLDREHKGFLRRADIPESHRVSIRRGSTRRASGYQEAIVISSLMGGESDEPKTMRGPLWFRKMDRNRDGDVSRKEFLFGEELFRKLDTDGDGLIGVEEAEKVQGLPR